MDIDWVLGKVAAKFLTLLLLQRIPRNHLKSLLDIDSLLGRGLKVRNAALGLAKGHGALGRNDALALLDIDLVAQNHKRERVRVARRGLNQELVAPAIEGVEGFGVVDIEDEYAAVGTTVEGDTERLEAFLTGCVPELRVNTSLVLRGHLKEAYWEDV